MCSSLQPKDAHTGSGGNHASHSAHTGSGGNHASHSGGKSVPSHAEVKCAVVEKAVDTKSKKVSIKTLDEH